MRPLDPRLLRRSRPVRRFLVATVLLGLVAAVAVVGQAWLLSATVVALVDGVTPTSVAAPAAALAGVVAARGVVAWAQASTGARAAVSYTQKTAHDTTSINS